jgi:hypothetical protein
MTCENFPIVVLRFVKYLDLCPFTLATANCLWK